MTTQRRSKGAHGPWSLADTRVALSGAWTGDFVDDFGTVTLAGASAQGDTVNVGEVATRQSTGGVMSSVHTGRGKRMRSSNPLRKR